MMNWETHRKILMKDPEVRKAWKETRLEYEIARALILARVKKRLTQAQLAKKINTKQSAISRLESGNYNPSLEFLNKVSQALGCKLTISLT